MSSTAFERKAIGEFLDQLSGQAGAEVELMSHPEDDPTGSLTVDALARVQGELWAIEHMRLAYEPTVVPAGDEAEKRLRGPLDDLASRHNRSLLVGVLPPRRRAHRSSEIEDYYSSIIRQAEAAILTGKDWFDQDGFTSVQVLDGPPRPDADRVEIATWLSGTASVEEQVCAALEDPLTEKLCGQLAVAKRAGFRVMILIDQVPDPSKRQPTVFLASWPTVKNVVDRLVVSFPNIVDSVWLRGVDGSFRNLTADRPEDLG